MRHVITVVTLILLCGCIESEQKADPHEQLVKSPANWVEKYGDSTESQQTANIVMAIQVINRQGEVINQHEARLKALEDAKIEIEDVPDMIPEITESGAPK